MTLPRLPGFIPADGSAAISDTQVQTQASQTSASMQIHTKTTHTQLQLTHIQPYKEQPYAHSRTLPSQDTAQKAVIYKHVRVHICVCVRVCTSMYVFPIKGEGGWRVEGESFILNSHKSCRRKMSKCAG